MIFETCRGIVTSVVDPEFHKVNKSLLLVAGWIMFTHPIKCFQLATRPTRGSKWQNYARIKDFWNSGSHYLQRSMSGNPQLNIGISAYYSGRINVYRSVIWVESAWKSSGFHSFMTNDARKHIYGMSYSEWKEKYQK